MAFLSRQTLGKKITLQRNGKFKPRTLGFLEKTASMAYLIRKFDNCNAFAKYIQINIYVQPDELGDFFQLFSFNKLFRNID